MILNRNQAQKQRQWAIIPSGVLGLHQRDRPDIHIMQFVDESVKLLWKGNERKNEEIQFLIKGLKEKIWG